MVKLRDDPLALLSKADELRSPLHLDAHSFQLRDEQPLVLVLRENAQIGIGRQAGSDLLERNARFSSAPRPKIDRRRLVRPFDDSVGKLELALKFAGAGLDGEGARGGARRV